MPPVQDPSLDPLVAEYLLTARSANTRRAYEADLRHFQNWGGQLPSTPEDIARYLAHSAAPPRPVALRRRLAALASAHRDAGLPDPTKALLVNRVRQGIERRHACIVRQARVTGHKSQTMVANYVRPSSILGGTVADLVPDDGALEVVVRLSESAQYAEAVRVLIWSGKQTLASSINTLPELA